MLKIKDNVDSKELEKYGFIKLNIMDGDDCIETNVYCAIQEDDKRFIENNCINDYFVEFYFNNKGEIDYCCYPEQRNEPFFNSIMFDLIKAGLVEKVEK
ncbi:MAG: hypothetical protein V8Q75_06335 [Bacilli bacterium]